MVETMTENHQVLSVDSVHYDTENPRIKKALEKYGDKINADRIYFALRSATDGTQGTSSYASLRDSILAHGGIASPITVCQRDDKYVCIDGNTRLAIYKQFLKEESDAKWSKIKAVVLNDAEQRDIEKIRVAAHLVGARQWPAYEKARYLHYLRDRKFMDYNEMIALCGGNKKDIERQIDAYHDMNEYYRDMVDDDTAFHIDRFSGFVELQKPGIKESIFEAGLELENFGQWIHDGRIYRLADVRQLPKVLSDETAKDIFLSGGPRSIEKATRNLDQRIDAERGGSTATTTLESASLHQLAEVMSRRIDDLPYSEIRALKKSRNENASADYLMALENLVDQIRNLLQDVGE